VLITNFQKDTGAPIVKFAASRSITILTSSDRYENMRIQSATFRLPQKVSLYDFFESLDFYALKPEKLSEGEFILYVFSTTTDKSFLKTGMISFVCI
jgi:hypothetical protein